MGTDSLLAAALYGLSAAVVWGVGDFSGGCATRRAHVVPVVLLAQCIGLASFVIAALVTGEPLPSAAPLAWSAAAGLFGLVGLSTLYRAMAVGQMGIVAPISGVITAAFPVVVGAFTQGIPAATQLAGFGLALAGVWFVSRGDGAAGGPAAAGVGLAILSGLGFGGFLVLVAQADRNAIFWCLAAERVSSIAVLCAVTLARRGWTRPPRSAARLIVLAGIMDAGGNALFVMASQAGRLDVAGVLSSLYPATTVILALLVLREPLARWQVAGVVLALIAIPLITLT